MLAPFNAAGRCTFMPAQETINPSACVRAFPVVEKHRLVWLWMGDPALADPAKVPDLHWNGEEPWVGEGGTFYGLKCDYRLVIDNLMDLTHETYVHAGSIGDDAITRAPFEVTHALIAKAVGKAGPGARGQALVDAMKGQAWTSPRGPIEIDPKTRDIVQNIYIRRTERVNGQLYNIEFATDPMVHDPAKAT